MWGEGKGSEKGEREPGAAPRRLKVQEVEGNQSVWIIWEGPRKEGQPSLWDGEFRVKDASHLL